MSTPPGTGAPPAPPPPRITPEPGSRLEQLLERRDALKAAKKEAEDRLKENTAGILAETIGRQPEGTETVDVAGSATRAAMRAHWVPGGWIVDTDKMKAEAWALWEHYKKPKKGHWSVDPVGSGT